MQDVTNSSHLESYKWKKTGNDIDPSIRLSHVIKSIDSNVFRVIKIFYNFCKFLYLDFTIVIKLHTAACLLAGPLLRRQSNSWLLLRSEARWGRPGHEETGGGHSRHHCLMVTRGISITSRVFTEYSPLAHVNNKRR